jgi:DnaJ-class molecular chaperone
MAKAKEEPKKEKVDKKVCNACKGTGKYFNDEKEKCNFCDGTGKLQ